MTAVLFACLCTYRTGVKKAVGLRTDFLCKFTCFFFGGVLYYKQRCC